jgi:hypothetical protein
MARHAPDDLDLFANPQRETARRHDEPVQFRTIDRGAFGL